LSSAPLELAVQYATPRRGVPHRRSIERWLRAALRRAASVTVRFVGLAEAAALNSDFRGRRKPTNVLAFSYAGPDPGGEGRRGRSPGLRGDIVICPQVIRSEARAQRKSTQAHYAHMVVHGALHLQGFDHHTDREAEIMEARERAILSGLGYPDPY
jgi:probable rRNA maturation factor